MYMFKKFNIKILGNIEIKQILINRNSFSNLQFKKVEKYLILISIKDMNYLNLFFSCLLGKNFISFHFFGFYSLEINFEIKCFY